jgi:hypothetical protein
VRVGRGRKYPLRGVGGRKYYFIFCLFLFPIKKIFYFLENIFTENIFYRIFSIIENILLVLSRGLPRVESFRGSIHHTSVPLEGGGVRTVKNNTDGFKWI